MWFVDYNFYYKACESVTGHKNVPMYHISVILTFIKPRKAHFRPKKLEFLCIYSCLRALKSNSVLTYVVNGNSGSLGILKLYVPFPSIL